MEIIPTGGVLGAEILGVDASKPLVPMAVPMAPERRDELIASVRQEIGA